MRRNTRYILKLLLLCVVTIVMTFVTFRLWKNVQHRFESNTSEHVVAQRLQSLQAPGDYIDYHDYKFMKMENARVGIGERGEPAFLTDHDESKRRQLFDMNGFNALLSDQISLNRSLKDIRNKE